MAGWQELNSNRDWSIAHKRSSDDKETPNKRPKLDYNDTVEILVGPKKTKFTVDRSALRSKSHHFRRGLLKDHLEVKFVKLDPTLFPAYVHWVYTSEIDGKLMSNNGEVLDSVKPTWFALVKFWELAEGMLDGGLCNKLTDMMLDKFEPNPVLVNGLLESEDEEGFVSTLEYVLDNSTHDIYKLRDLFTDLCFTGVRQSLGYDTLLNSLSSDTLACFVRRWVEGERGFQIPQNAAKRKECAKRYYKECS